MNFDKYIRIIPKLEVKGLNLVKGIRLDGLRVLGNPEEFANEYSKEGADEIYFQDVVASLYNQTTLYDILNKVSKKSFVPITAGGGVKNINDIELFLKSGADRVAINSSLFKNFSLLKNAILKFGIANIVVSIEVVNNNNNYIVTSNSGREYSGIKLADWIKKINSVALVEFFITCVDRDGTGKNFDEKLINELKKFKNSFIIIGGISNLNFLANSLKKNSFISGIGIASSLHYNKILKKKLKYDDYGNTQFLKFNVHKPNNLQLFNIKKIKKYLKNHNLSIREEA